MSYKPPFEMINFFDLKEDDLIVLNPYNFEDAIKRLENLTLEDVQDDLKNFQKKEFEFRNYEEENIYTLDNIQFITSSKDENGEKDFYKLNDLSEYLISDEELNKKNENKDIPDKKIYLEIKNQEGGKKDIFVKFFVKPEKFSENVINNFINKSTFQKAKDIKEDFVKNLKEKMNNFNFKVTIKIESNSIIKIYNNKNKGEYYFDLQSPPLFRTNFLVYKEKNEKEKPSNYIKDENSIFPFRNFQDEISNLKYRHFILMIQKKIIDTTPRDENDMNLNFDTNDELNNSLENFFKNRNGEIDKTKYIPMEIKLKNEDKNKNISKFFNYENNKDIKTKLEKLLFLKKDDDDMDEQDEENCKDKEVITLFYQVLALISECILSYYNGEKFLDNLLNKGMYRKDIFDKCRDEDFPEFFNLTLTKILDKYQNSLIELTLKELEKEMESQFNYLYDQYESVGKEEIFKPSKNEILMRVQRCVITPTYILFTPYVLDQGNRILRDFINTDNAMLCTFKTDSLEEARWNNKFLMEYIKFILSRGFNIGEKNFKFFNYSQSQFRNMSCWLLTEPEKIIEKIGDFSKIKQLSKYAARISQTLTTTIKTIKIPKDKIVDIPDKKSSDGKYTFSDGVGQISYILSKQISEKLKLDYVPSCFQGRFLGCKGVWTTMWNDNSGKIYCRDSQTKFLVEKKKENYFELCDYSRYIQSYLNRQIIILLSALGIDDKKFLKKLDQYKSRLNDQSFVLGLIHYPEWNQMFRTMYSCGIDRTNDRLLKSVIESNLDILYNDIKKKARIYVEESAYVIGIMDEYNVLEYGEAFLQIKRGDFSIILNKKCVVAKCPCLHPGDIRVLNFKKYNKNDESTKKYEKLQKYENVIIFPSKGKRPHPDECSGSDLDGDNYFIFYDDDLIPQKTMEPMSYLVQPKKEENKKDKFEIKDVIEYFAEYTNLNSLGLIGDAHLAFSDQCGADGVIPLKLADKFSKAVDAPKTGDKIELEENETPQQFPHYMGKDKNKSYISKKILGQLYDKANEFIYKRIKRKELSGNFYDKDLKLKYWENYAFLALIYYRDYFNDLVSMLKKNEISGESVLLTGNNIDNENSVLSKKKHNYDLREKIGSDMHNLFVKSRNDLYDAITNIFTQKNNTYKNINLINILTYFHNNLHLFASACYIISYNILESVINNKDNSIDNYCQLFTDTINESLIIENDYEELNEISEYESLNFGVDYYECNESSYDVLYGKNELIMNTINKKKKDMKGFVKELKKNKIPQQFNEENQYRILSFPWCISGHILSNIKFLNCKNEELIDN